MLTSPLFCLWVEYGGINSGRTGGGLGGKKNLVEGF